MRAIVIVIIACATLQAQQPGISCAPWGVDKLVRAGGKSELTGDFVLLCHGGQPTPLYAPVPLYTIQVEMAYAINSSSYTSHYKLGGSLNVKSRPVGTDGYLETLLIVNEPRSITNPTVPLSLCYHASLFSPLGVCPIVGSGTGKSQYDGSPGHPNVYQGRLINAHVIEWKDIPIDFGPEGTNVVRVTNLRVDTTPIPPMGIFDSRRKVAALPHVIAASGAQVPIIGVTSTVWPIPGGQVGIVSPLATVQLSDPLTLDQCQGNNVALLSDPTQSAEPTFLVFVMEGGATAFRRKNWSLTGDDVNQNVTNIDYWESESGFENLGAGFDPDLGVPMPPSVAFPLATGLSRAGLADQGTRIAIQFASVPEGVSLFVPPRRELISQANASVLGELVLVVTDALGAGPFQPVKTSGAWTPVSIVHGEGMAVYEVVNNDGTNAMQFTVPVAVANVAGAPAAGIQATVNVAGAPFAASSSVPRFGTGSVMMKLPPSPYGPTEAVLTPQPAFRFVSCGQ